MRTTTHFLIALACVGLLVGAAAGVMAAGPESRSDRAERAQTLRGGDHGGHHNETNASDNESARSDLRSARAAAMESFHENRTAALREYNQTLHAIKEAFLAAKKQVIEACQAQRNATNTSGNDSVRQCVKDGLKPLIEEARADMKEAKELCQQKLLSYRTKAIAGFREAKARAAEHRPTRA
ncbi:MAG TPA: hypothetical protein VNZ52_14620 [Candidatus Thermoplasmatota archaeon]|nr:hypothetical protein [Candidatus Thermoplasmatota archaeon]